MLKKRIAFDEKHAEAIKEAIKAAEGRATARTITIDTMKRVLEKASAGIPKKALHGTRIHYDGGQHFPSAYKYRPESTHFDAAYIRGKWYITNIFRFTCPNRQTDTEVFYSDEAKAAIIKARSVF